MNRLYYILASFCFIFVICGILSPQDAVFYRLPYANVPVIDGTIDPIWNEVEIHNIELADTFNSSAGYPTIDLATWKAAWNDSCIFFLLTVEEDDFYPSYEAGSHEHWIYDRCEVFIDINDNLEDGGGPENTIGHYQLSESFYEGRDQYDTTQNIFGGKHELRPLASYGYRVDNSDYNYEYAVYINTLLDNNYDTLDPFYIDRIGFDIQINDRDVGDAGVRFAVWKNIGENSDSWSNMDDCGEVVFSSQETGDTITYIYKLPEGYAPVIDGVKDLIWDYVDVKGINRHFVDERPTLDNAMWQAAWNDTALFVIVSVEEDDFCPAWCEPAQVEWFSDKPELFMDVNDFLKDGQGPVGYPNGHYLLSPPFVEGKNTYFIRTDYGHVYSYFAYMVNETDYIFEYAILFRNLLDDNQNELAPAEGDQMGFDVYIVDRDEGEDTRKRATWKNTGEVDEAWINMDDCGILEFTTTAINDAGFTIPNAKIKKLPDGSVPAIDGSPDHLWSNVEKHNIEKPFKIEIPSIDTATWQAVWNDTTLFVLVTVNEDDFCPAWCTPEQFDYVSDRPEIYLDVNDTLKDGLGVIGYPNGHYIFYPVFIEGEDINTYSGYSTQGWYYNYSYQVNDPDYIYECAIPLSTLYDRYGNELIITEGKQIGFDVTVIDRDEGEALRNRAVWINDGKGTTLVGAWENMNDCGIVEFSTEEIEAEIPAEISITPSISANKVTICRGEIVKLQAACTDCEGAAITYSWSSVPTGFTSALNNPEVSPDVTTTYKVNVSDGINYDSTSQIIKVLPSPDKPEIRLKGEDILICIDSGLYSYQWYYNDEIISGETKQFCQVNLGLTGNFFVETGYGNQCKTKSDSFNFGSKLATLKNIKPHIEIYPVPNTGNFTFGMSGDQSGRIVINIRDFSGKVIKNIIIDKNTEPVYKEINTLNIPKGIYILDILFNNEIYIRRILIN